MYIYICVCVCVWNIPIDVKLVPWYILVPGEWWAFLESTLNEDIPSLLWYAIWTQIARTCARYCNRLSSEPARRFVFPLHVWTVGAIWISTRITLGYFWWEAYVRMRVTNLDFILHYWRNSRLWFWSFTSIYLFPLGYVDDGLPPLEFPTLWPDKCNENVFLHTRCVPHHNSIKQFWANMCDVGFDRMTWALRGISF